ncbi:hypothetical protein BH23ACT12_BH23ACT12_01990 [soil metagenome]
MDQPVFGVDRADPFTLHLTRLAIALGVRASEILPASNLLADALAAHTGATKRLGPIELWQFAALASGGLLINTNPHLSRR